MDPIPSGRWGDGKALGNPFSFVGNHGPLGFDPLGLCGKEKWAGIPSGWIEVPGGPNDLPRRQKRFFVKDGSCLFIVGEDGMLGCRDFGCAKLGNTKICQTSFRGDFVGPTRRGWSHHKWQGVLCACSFGPAVSPEPKPVPIFLKKPNFLPSPDFLRKMSLPDSLPNPTRVPKAPELGVVFIGGILAVRLLLFFTPVPGARVIAITL